MRRNILILIGVVILVSLGVAWYVLREPSADPADTSGTFPTVGGPATPTGPGNTSDFFDDPIDASERPVAAAARLVKITDGPVAHGLSALTETSDQAGTTTSSNTIGARVRYIERASGNAYEYRSSTKSIARLTSRTMPGITTASWLTDGSRAYVQYQAEGSDLSTYTETYALPITGEGEGQLLPRNLAAAIADGNTSVITLSTTPTGSVALRAGIGGIGGTALFETPLSRIFAFPSNAGLFVHTPASASVESYLFLVRAGRLERISAPSRGMTALPSPDGARVLISYINAAGDLSMGMVETETRTFTTLPVATLTEKCTFTKDSLRVYCGVPAGETSGVLPDEWYQGVFGFRDQIWEIDFENRLALFVADLPNLAEAPIDAVSLATDPSGKGLFFMNRNDGSLWAYEL